MKEEQKPIDGGRIEWAKQIACRFYGRIAYDSDYDGVVLSNLVENLWLGF